MYINKLNIMLIIFMLASFWSAAAYSQAVIHHDLVVKLIPKKQQIQVLDEIDLSSLYENGTRPTTPKAFLIHAGDRLKVIEKNVTLKKRGYAFGKKHFPRLLGEKLMVGTVPVDVYSLEMPPSQKTLRLKYNRNIYHAIETGVKEYARSIRSSAGLISEQGVFIAKESFWFPVFGNELLTFNLNVTSPAGWKTVSQGERIKEESQATSHNDIWREMRAQDDIYLVAAKFTEYSQMAGRVKAMAFLRTPDDALAQKYLDTTAQYLEMYRNLLGPYPYSKFALVENFWETGFGMPSFTLLGPKIIRFPFILHSSYPHELLHNWWGNSVYVDYEKGNWAEGLTSYLADHLVKEQRGKGQDYRRGVLQKYTNFANLENDFALATFISRYDGVTEAVGYGKTLMLFHMLRQKMGDDIFSRGLQMFYRDYRHKTASYADIEKVFADVSGRDLKPFFEQWVSKIGAPTIALKQAKIEQEASGKYRMDIAIEQTQKGDAYQIVLPLQVSLKNKKTAAKIDFVMKNKTERLTLMFDAQPLRVDVDPEFDVFRRLDINETPPVLSQMFGAKQSLIVLPSKASKEKLQAYRQLAKNWQASQQGHISIEYDKDLKRLPQDKSIWVLGWENQWKDEFFPALKAYDIQHETKKINLVGQSISSGKNAIVLVGRNPEKMSHSLALISADTAEAISGLARKLPHYGKYSYLAFDGMEPKNHLKGQWPVVNSPLTFHFSKDAALSPLKERAALATMAPLFSEQRLMKHVKHLASQEMLGRGLGSKGLDKSATYIANEFHSAGLLPLLPEQQFFQRWQQRIEGESTAIEMSNVMAYLPGNNPKYKGQSIVVSAHYDHLGLGEREVRKGNEGKLHFGADDNASGVAVLLELGRLLAKKGGLDRSVIFIAFTGEEANRLGSRYFVKNVPLFSAKKIFAAVNLDTVGRLENKPLIVFGTGSASEWVHVFRGVGFVTGIKIKSLANNFGSSDESSFHDINIPAVQFFSGVNADFHQPSDTFDKIDGPGLVKVATVLKETVQYLSERELPLTNLLNPSDTKRKKVTRGRRVSLGTVPDFSYQGEGVLVSGIVPGSPAEQAKIAVNDVLIAINGKAVIDLRSFSSILRGLNPGDEIQVTLLRNKQKVQVKTRLIAR